MNSYQVEIVTPSKTAFTGKAVSLTIPGSLSPFQVLNNHAPIISSFEIGTITLVDENSVKTLYATGGGTVEVNANKVLILANSVETTEEIDRKRAEAAKLRAEERLKNKNSEVDVTRAEAALARAVNRLKIIG